MRRRLDLFLGVAALVPTDLEPGLFGDVTHRQVVGEDADDDDLRQPGSQNQANRDLASGCVPITQIPASQAMIIGEAIGRLSGTKPGHCPLVATAVGVVGQHGCHLPGRRIVSSAFDRGVVQS